MLTLSINTGPRADVNTPQEPRRALGQVAQAPGKLELSATAMRGPRALSVRQAGMQPTQTLQSSYLEKL